MIYKLYGDKRSGSATIELALAEIGVEFDVSDVSIDDDPILPVVLYPT